MFGNIDKNRGLLFCTYQLDQSLRGTLEKMRQEVESVEANRLLNTAPNDLAEYLAKSYRVEPLRLLRDSWYADTDEVSIDVRHDRMRLIHDTSEPVMVPGERVDVRVPFEGESELFYSSPNKGTMNPPRATVDGNELLLRYEYPSDAPRNVRPEVDRTLGQIDEYIEWQRPMLEAHNGGLLSAAADAIRNRRERLLAQSHRVASLGIPVRPRADAPKTYAVPTVRKRAAPTLPPASPAPFAPEPVWAMEHYEQALQIMQDMALVMERSPNAFKTMDEEAIRQHFLMQLNGQFEGKATGETFNMSGKTDILLREGDRNVFIAECKFWKGPKVFREAIDQLLAYTTWRDTKSVILVFNRGTETSTVLRGIDAEVRDHSNFKRVLAWPHESGFRYILHSNGDTNRELILTVLVFHVPS